MHFASAIYLPSFSASISFASIDFSKHKVSEQQATTPATTGQSQQQKNCNKKWNVSKVNNKETRMTSTVSLLLTLCILVSFILTLNVFHILCNVQYAKIQAFSDPYFLVQGYDSTLTYCKLRCFSLPPIYKPPKYRPIKFYFVFIYIQGVLTGFYIIWEKSCS